MSDKEKLSPAAHTGTESAEDVAAVGKIADLRAKRLEQLQGRADKWIGGLTAITGLLTTAVVIKGPEAFTDLDTSRQGLVIALMVTGGVCLGLGVSRAYTAAYGTAAGDAAVQDLDALLDADEAQVQGAANKYRVAVANSVASARDNLRAGVRWTIIGIIVLVLAVLATWLSPEAKDDDPKICIRGENDAVLVVTAAPTVKAGTVTVIECPKAEDDGA